MTSKACFRCSVDKPLSDYHKHRGRKDGHNDVCKTCATAKQSMYAQTEGAKIARKKFFDEYKEREDVRERRQKYFRDYQSSLSEKQKTGYALVRKMRKEASPKYALYVALFHAFKRRPSEDFITREQAMDIFQAQDGRCAVSGVRMTWSKGKKLATSMSLDRIDGSRGYQKDNVRLVCWQVNLFKNEWSDAQMQDMAKNIVSVFRMKSDEPQWISFQEAVATESQYMGVGTCA